MSQPTCELCSRPMPDTAYVCPACTKRAGEDLERIVDYAPEVEIAVLKLVRYGDKGRASGERPVPFDDKRDERAAAVGNTVATWARHVAESRGVAIPRPPGMPGAAAAASFLADPEQLNWLRHQQEAKLAMGELRDASRELQRIIDRPRDLWYAGACWNELDNGERCPNELYVASGARIIVCRSCDAEYDAEGRREWLLAEAYDALVHAELMARALTALGVEDLTAARVRGMARHGRLADHGTDPAGRPLYKVGEVLAVIDEQVLIEEGRKRRREAKAAKAEARLAEKVAAAEEAA